MAAGHMLSFQGHFSYSRDPTALPKGQLKGPVLTNRDILMHSEGAFPDTHNGNITFRLITGDQRGSHSLEHLGSKAPQLGNKTLFTVLRGLPVT